MLNPPFAKNSILLAPMAGITDSGFRTVCRKYGADCTVTEMISSRGIFHNDLKSKALMEYTEAEKPVIVQLFGNDCDCMKYAAEFVEKNAFPAAIDINMGCPAPKIYQNGDGCALMKSPDKAASIISSVKGCVNVPVGVKFRSGTDRNNINAVQFAEMCESAGADYITIHGRTREQFYSGCSDKRVVSEVISAVNIPVIANGDIIDSESASLMLNTGAYAVMVGRGALGNPLVFNKIKSGLGLCEPIINADIFDIAIEHLGYVIKDKGELLAVKEFRKHMLWYLKGIKNAAEYKRRSCQVNTFDDCLKIFESAKNEI